LEYDLTDFLVIITITIFLLLFLIVYTDFKWKKMRIQYDLFSSKAHNFYLTAQIKQYFTIYGRRHRFSGPGCFQFVIDCTSDKFMLRTQIWVGSFNECAQSLSGVLVSSWLSFRPEVFFFICAICVCVAWLYTCPSK
jgi:hypothetical protein